MSHARHDASARGTRILRASSTLRAAGEVWSDVASAHGFSFRSDDAGPVLSGDLRSGGQFEVGVSEDKHGQYATLAAVRLPAPLAASVVARPHRPWTRALALLSPPPDGLAPELASAFLVRATPADAALRVLTPELQALLSLMSDRLPQLRASGDEVLLVLDGVELAHERVEALLGAFETLLGPATRPYR